MDDKIFPRRSQYGRITILANPEMWDGELGHGYYIASKSGLIHRVCQSTMRAETHGAIKSTGIGWKIRCALTQASGIQLRRRWEDDASRHIRHKWITDCKSLFDYLIASRSPPGWASRVREVAKGSQRKNKRSRQKLKRTQQNTT